MAEYAEVTDKLSELRSQKQKLSRQVRDKEEELETAMQKIDSYRNDMRKADKSRREYESRIEDVIAEVTKVRSLLIVYIRKLLIVIFCRNANYANDPRSIVVNCSLRCEHAVRPISVPHHRWVCRQTHRASKSNVLKLVG